MDRDVLLCRLPEPITDLSEMGEEQLAVISDDTGIVAELAELLPVTGPRDWGILHQDEAGAILLLLFKVRGGPEADRAIDQVCFAYGLNAFDARSGARIDGEAPADDLMAEVSAALGF
jgi:hypothetical protein